MTSIANDEFLIKFGDGASPESFTKWCGLTSKSFTRTANARETIVLDDCDDDEAVAVVERDIASKDWQLTGSITLDRDEYDLLDDWYHDDDAKPRSTQVLFKGTGNEGRTYSGLSVLTNLGLASEIGDKVKAEVTVQGAGALTRVKGTVA
jgi:hypothetical protein